MKKITFLLILTLGLFVTHAQADISSGSYFGIEYANLNTELTIPDATQIGGTRVEDPTLDAFVLRVGHYFTNYLAAEFHLGSSLTEENGSRTKEAKMRSLYGLFVKGNFPLHAQNTNLYVLLGGSYSELKLTESPSASNLSGITNITASGLSYAFGVELYATPTMAVNIEYVRYLSDDEVDVGGFALGFIKHFNAPKLY